MFISQIRSALTLLPLLAACTQTPPQQQYDPNPTPPPAPPSKAVTISNPVQERAILSHALFRMPPENLAGLDAKGLAAIPAAKDQGAYGYYVGIRDGVETYTWQEVEQKYGDELRQLEGASVYLLGTARCRNAITDDGCFTAASPEDVLKANQQLDFDDDFYNLAGSFLVINDAFADGNSPSSCTMRAVTFGSDKTRVCGLFAMHNLAPTAYTLQLRKIAEFYRLNGFTGAPDFLMSSCSD